MQTPDAEALYSGQVKNIVGGVLPYHHSSSEVDVDSIPHHTHIAHHSTTYNYTHNVHHKRSRAPLSRVAYTAVD